MRGKMPSKTENVPPGKQIQRIRRYDIVKKMPEKGKGRLKAPSIYRRKYAIMKRWLA